MEAAFFDLDKTVIAKASMVAFSRTFYRRGLLSRGTVLRALWAQLIFLHLGASEVKLTRIRESVLTLTRGWEQARVREIVAETLAVIVEPITFAEALELIDEHKAAGRRVYIISASPSEIVEPLARFLGVDDAIASQARVDENGCYTGEMDVYAYGPYKAELIRQVAARDGIDLSESFAYSDSYTDLPMLDVVGHPVVVNPDRVLLKVARERGWEVQQFVQPVRLRDRMPVPPAKTTAVVGISAALAGAVLVVWRVRRRLAPPAQPRARRVWVSGRLAEFSRRGAFERRMPSSRGGRRRGEASS
ncbi:MAG TPA: HAD-IB family hydrolase [Acidimicrobiales bacterium]|nr:HAD-IB family hydrolase [Acidimicrobiales bacterium]